MFIRRLNLHNGRRAAAPGVGQVRPGGRQRRGEDEAHLRTRVQAEGLTVTAAQHPRADSLGHRPVPHLQGCESIASCIRQGFI